ncbi:MAG: hypothetical protein ABSE19_10480 [Candidatus Acidiferrum sp.]
MLVRFKGQPQTQRGPISSLGERDKVTDQRQSRFSQNHFTSSGFTIMDPTIIETSTVNDGTSPEFTVCFIYLRSNMRKRKNQNKRSRGGKGLSNLGLLQSFPFPSLGMQKKSVEEFHFGTPARRFGLKLAGQSRGAPSC